MMPCQNCNGRGIDEGIPCECCRREDFAAYQLEQRRDLEQLAATVFVGISRTYDEIAKLNGEAPKDKLTVVKEAVATAKALQAEARKDA